MKHVNRKVAMTSMTLMSVLIGMAPSVWADDDHRGNDLPKHREIRSALQKVVEEDNGGFGLNMWATIVDRDGRVHAVAFSGNKRDDQWPGSRNIATQKANTANAFSLPGLALSTANLFTAVQPGGSLFGLQHSNPIATDAAYKGPARKFGAKNDPMVGRRVGGVNVFGGGLALYSSDGEIVGGIGVSGDSSCADHNIAWKLRHELNLDNVPAGIRPAAGDTSDDNIINDIADDGTSPSGWGHPVCSEAAATIASELPNTHPVGSDP